MRIKIETKVNQGVVKVMEGFDESLFLKLNPPFPKVKVKRFDGCIAGNIVALELNFLLFKQEWISEIVEDQNTEGHFHFVDIGTKMPGLFKYWRHKHLIEEKGGQTVITDDITFNTPNILVDCLMYPLLYLQFMYRIPVYRNVFK